MAPNLDFRFSLPPVLDDLAGNVTCVAVHVLNISSMDSLVIVVSLVLIDAGTFPGIDGATLLAPFSCWSNWTVANLVSSS